GANGKALASEDFEGSGWVPLEQINTSTDALTTRTDDPGSGGSGSIRMKTIVHRSADRSLFILAEANISSAPLFTYNASTATFPHSFQLGGFLDNSSPVVNRNGTLIAISSGSSVTVYNPSFNAVQTLSGVSGGLSFDPTQDVLYVADTTTNKLFAYDTNTWTL